MTRTWSSSAATSKRPTRRDRWTLSLTCDDHSLIAHTCTVLGLGMYIIIIVFTARSLWEGHLPHTCTCYCTAIFTCQHLCVIHDFFLNTLIKKGCHIIFSDYCCTLWILCHNTCISPTCIAICLSIKFCSGREIHVHVVLCHAHE